MDKKELSKLFNEYVGQSMKDPNRFTDDLCPVMNPIAAIAMENGLDIIRVILPGQTMDKAIRKDRVTVMAEKSGDSLYPYRVKKIGLY